MEEFELDLLLMFNNARTYNQQPGSTVYAGTHFLPFQQSSPCGIFHPKDWNMWTQKVVQRHPAMEIPRHDFLQNQKAVAAAQ